MSENSDSVQGFSKAMDSFGSAFEASREKKKKEAQNAQTAEMIKNSEYGKSFQGEMFARGVATGVSSPEDMGKYIPDDPLKESIVLAKAAMKDPKAKAAFNSGVNAMAYFKNVEAMAVMRANAWFHARTSDGSEKTMDVDVPTDFLVNPVGEAIKAAEAASDIPKGSYELWQSNTEGNFLSTYNSTYGKQDPSALRKVHQVISSAVSSATSQYMGYYADSSFIDNVTNTALLGGAARLRGTYKTNPDGTTVLEPGKVKVKTPIKDVISGRNYSAGFSAPAYKFSNPTEGSVAPKVQVNPQVEAANGGFKEFLKTVTGKNKPFQ